MGQQEKIIKTEKEKVLPSKSLSLGMISKLKTKAKKFKTKAQIPKNIAKNKLKILLKNHEKKVILKEDNNKNILKYKKESQKMINKSPYFLFYKEEYSWQSILLQIKQFDDNQNFLVFRKTVFIIKSSLSLFASIIVQSKFFNCVTFCVIFTNCLYYMVELKLNKNIKNNLELFFLEFYLAEMFLKMISNGVFRWKNSYFRNNWNIFDFILVAFSAIILVSSKSFIVFGPFRILKILTVVKDEKLISILYGIYASVKMLINTLAIFFFISAFYTLIGMQLFHETLLQKCLEINTGIFQVPDAFCGNVVCPENFICSKDILEPDFGATSFESFFYAWIQVFRVMTLNSWTYLMNSIQKTFTNYIW